MIPVVTLGSENIRNEILDSCREYGFFYLNNENSDGSPLIDTEILEKLRQDAHKLFEIGTDEKKKNHVSLNRGNRGYFCSMDYKEINRDPHELSIADNKEGYFFASENLYDCPNRLPQGVEHQLEFIEHYMKSCRNICAQILDILGFSFDDPVYMFKILSYPEDNGSTDAHTDYGCLTLLHATDDGLEILIHDEWIKIPTLKNVFVVNVGDFLQALTGGMLRSTIHRVIHDKKTRRLSFPFFFHADKETRAEIEGREFSVMEYIDDRFARTYNHRK